jgi:hypothetical protein
MANGFLLLLTFDSFAIPLSCKPFFSSFPFSVSDFESLLLKRSFIPHLIQTLFKCRRISEVGAQQLMLDFTAIKTILLELPKSGKPDPAPVTRYSKHVQKEMGKAELLLKVISSPGSTARFLLPFP